MAVKPRNLSVSTLPKIHQMHPEVGKALKEIIEYINRNLAPKQGNKQS